jgi:Ca2+-binding EF-hand superfamily protein
VLGGSNSVLTKAQLTKIVGEADKGTRDGQISFEEFASIMRNNTM